MKVINIRYRLLLVMIGIAFCITIALYLTRRISGGETMVKQVVSALETNLAITTIFGQPLLLARSNGPWRVALGQDGLRNGFYSFSAKGSRRQGAIKVEWAQISTNRVDILRVSLSRDWKDDEPIWEKGPKTN